MASENTRRIAKNTAMLYIRMLLTMAVTLYTSRVVLNVLGVEDYGIYNVVGGVVVLFSFLNSVMLLSNQRFLSFELGRNNEKRVGQIYRTSMKLYLCIALVLLILAETIGLWFLNHYLNIPSQKMIAANWVYQFSIIGALAGVFRIPYHALIIAYEKMSFFAYISLGEVILKLFVVYFLFIIDTDKLIYYSVFTTSMMVIITIMYGIYCYYHFRIIRKKYEVDKLLFKELIRFSGWSLGLGISNLAVSQGTNMIFNVFYGVLINAALGITNQVHSAIFQFVSNFQTALNPQLIKSYASQENERLFSLVYKGSKFSFFLMLFLSWPIIINAEYILSVWLKTVPPYTVQFVQLILIYGLIDTLINPLAIVVQASGIIRKYQLVCSIIMLSNIPLIFILIYCSVNPIYIFAGRVFINLLSLLWRLFYFRSNFGMSFNAYWHNVLKGIVLVGINGILLTSIPVFYFENLVRLFVTVLSWVIIFSLLVWFVGISKSDQIYLRECWQGLCRKFKI